MQDQKEKTLAETIAEQIAKDTDKNINTNIEEKEAAITTEVLAGESKDTQTADNAEVVLENEKTNTEVSEADTQDGDKKVEIIRDPNGTPEQQQAYEDYMNEPVGDLGLTRRDLVMDQTTPGSSMSNLDKFTSNYSKEVADAKATADLVKAEKETADKLAELKAKKAESAKFNDEIIEEKEEELVTSPKIDVTSVKIRKVEDSSKAFNSILANRKNKKKTTSVPLANSGYIAHMTGLSSPEIRDMSLSLQTRDQYSYWDYLYQLIHSKMQSTSIGAMDYNTFLKSTALSELDILMYGMFCSTYPDKNDFPIVCQNPSCKSHFDFSYDNSMYLNIDDDDKQEAVTAMRALIAGQAVDPKDFFENSNTNSVFRIPLNNSGYIVEVRHPTLWNQLHDVIRQMVENQIEKASDVTLNRMPYVQKVLVPSEDGPNSGYYEFDGLVEKVSLLTDLDEQDDLDLENGISDDILSKYKVNFRMTGVTCPICLKGIADAEVDFRNLLFTIHQIRSVRRK